MARKFDLISELYDRTCKVVSENPEQWQAFLKTAGRNFRLRFDEQLLVFAQKPDATAVLEMERWNRNFGRWVNRGTRGIAVFERLDGNKGRLTHYFDISDTHDNPRSRPVPIWEMKPEYEQDVIETLEATFGEVSDNTDLAEVIRESAGNAVDDNITDYFTEFSEYDELNKYSDEELYSRLIKNSVSYMIMARLGIDADRYYTPQDFAGISEFGTRESLNGIGAAVSDIAEMGLAPISRTIFALDKGNRIIAENPARSYNENEIQTERSQDNDRTYENQLHESGRLRASEPDDARTAGGSPRNVGENETEVSGGASQDNVSQPADSGDTDSSLGGGTGASDETRRNPDGSDGSETGRDGEAESREYDGLGAEDEQYQELSSGNSQGSGDIQLEYYDRSHEDNSLPYLHLDYDVKLVLLATPHLKAKPAEIAAYYEGVTDDKARVDYVKSIFNNEFTEVIVADGRRMGYKTYQNVLHVWEGSYLNRTAQTYYDWGVIARMYEGMRLLGELQGTAKILPSYEQQNIAIREAGFTPASFFSQEIIDTILTRGSGVSEGKMRIYRQFTHSLSAKENADFLKKEYGWGGVAPVITGTGIDEMHDGKGIKLSRGFGNGAFELLLTWNKVERRISELIKLDRYLNPKEKEQYPIWLERRELQEAENEERRKNRDIISTAPDERKPETPDTEAEYEYHLGDKVYIGSSEFEIVAFDDDRVTLFDSSFPLFNKELPRTEFDTKVRENPLNDHLKVKAEAPISEPVQTENKFVSVWADYNRIKAESPDNIVLYQIGDFYEVMGEDAKTVADELSLSLTSRDVGESERVPMCGFPAFKMTDYIVKLTENHSLSLSAIQENERKTFNILSKAQALGQDVDLLDRAKELIDNFCRKEYEQEDGANYDDLTNVNVAYTTTEDEKHEIEASIDLVHFTINTAIDGQVVRVDGYRSLEELVDELPYLDFNELVYVDESQIELIERNHPVEEKPAETEKSEIIPEWEKPRQRQAQTYDIHPEIPMSERNSFDLKNNPVEQVGKKERFRRNIEAIQLLKKCQSENRFATPEEQIILSKYVGWGGIPEAFDERNAAWETEYLELSSVLTPDEYAAARESTLTAFYTPPKVTAAIYKAMEQMGFKDGNLLEPSCGIGNFIGMMPDSMQDAKIYGVELDKISAGIAQQLYQKSSIAADGFENVTLPDSFFDGVVGNVPFGEFSVADKKYDKYHFLIHDYFFAKSLDKLRPGGVMALVTSKGTMDKKNSSVRKYLAQRADLLGAIRLPNNTFKGNAGTEVVSDIIFLQKRDRIVDLEPEWVQTTTDENGREMNAYFANHPEMVLGEWKTVSGRFGDEDTVVPYEGTDLSELLNEAISNIQGEIGVYDTLENVELDEDNSIPADPTVRNFSFTVVDDKIYFRQNSRMNPVDVSATAENRIKGMIGIRDAVRELIELQTEDYPDEQIRQSQQRLNEVYDRFTRKYGLLNSRANKSAFSDDSSYCLLSALEVINENGELERKADMFTKRTIKPHKPITEVDTPSEALALSIGEKAMIDIPYMQELCHKSEEEIYKELKGVIFLNPLYEFGDKTAPKYLMADEYLSGNVREKLETAKRSAKIYPDDYSINVEALEKVQPKDLSASEISVRLGSTWVPPEIVEQFMYEFLETPFWARYKVRVHYSGYTGEWNVENKSYDSGNIKANKTYGTNRINAYKIIEETLNLKDVRIFDYVEDEDGKRKAILNTKETAIAQAKQELIKQAFKDWIWDNPQRREKLTKLYNEKFNSIRPREYDGSHLIFSGMNPEITLREHQKNAVAHILYGGNTLLAHAVGAGKTYEMVAAAQESKRLGLCTKSLFVVPNHLTEQWAGEYLQLYPAAKILVATKKDFETANRKKFCGRIATGDYDAVIIGHSQFEKIPMSAERQIAMLNRQRDDLLRGIAEAKANNGDYFSIKQLEKTKKSIEAKLKKMNDQSKKDDVVTFEELGVDRLFY